MRAILLLLILATLVGATAQVWEHSALRGESRAEPASQLSDEGAAAADPGERLVKDAEYGRVRGIPNDANQRREVAESAPPPGQPAFYQWVDERGSVHFAGSLDEVPANWRSRAGQVQLDSAAFNQTAAPTAKPARPRRVADAAPHRSAHDVTVYTAPWCGWCRKTLAFLDQRGVDYVNKDIEDDADYAQELREKTGGTAIPLVEIDGNAIRGFDPGRMTALLD